MVRPLGCLPLTATQLREAHTVHTGRAEDPVVDGAPIDPELLRAASSWGRRGTRLVRSAAVSHGQLTELAADDFFRRAIPRFSAGLWRQPRRYAQYREPPQRIGNHPGATRPGPGYSIQYPHLVPMRQAGLPRHIRENARCTQDPLDAETSSALSAGSPRYDRQARSE